MVGRKSGKDISGRGGLGGGWHDGGGLGRGSTGEIDKRSVEHFFNDLNDFEETLCFPSCCDESEEASREDNLSAISETRIPAVNQ